VWQVLIVNLLCILIVLGSVAVAAWTVVTGQIVKQGIDALFLLFVCLTMAAAFLMIPYQAWRQGTLQQALTRPKAGGDDKEEPASKGDA